MYERVDNQGLFSAVTYDHFSAPENNQNYNINWKGNGFGGIISKMN